MSNKMWGGRFETGPAAIMEEINASIDFDKRLWRQDIRGSKAHAAMLAKQGIISRSDASAIRKGLTQIEAEIESGVFKFSRALEDIHMNIESRLAEIIGPAAGRLHTARSRNDQVALDMRLYVRDALGQLDAQCRDLQLALAAKALEFAGAVIPGFTHLQPAQPTTLGHHLLAYVEMLARDRGRFQDAARRLNESPLGAAALCGTSFPVDRHATAKALGFDRPTANSLDSVADRDFSLETLAAASISFIRSALPALPIWPSRPKVFSTTTTAPSTIRPIAIANPPSDIRFADISSWPMTMKVNSGVKINVQTTIRLDRTSPRKTNNTMTTRMTPSSSTIATVFRAELTRSVRS